MIDRRLLDNFEIILCPTLALAMEQNPDITIEAEYGDICVEGKELTLAHHGSRSSNPAPCNTKVKPLKGGKIVISHIDLDTVGGIMAVTGTKIEDDDFWKAEEYIDVNGPHHIREFPIDIQEKMNAINACRDKSKKEIFKESTNVKEQILDYYDILEKALIETHPEHKDVLEKGRVWEKEISKVIEEKLLFENKYIRVFITDGVFCSSSYYSPRAHRIVPCTIVFNEIYKSITIAFESNKYNLSANEIVQSLWGEEAGGHTTIAGSPRGMEMTKEDFNKAIDLILELFKKESKK